MLGTRADLDEMIRLRKLCDAILYGASTLRVYQKPCKVKGANPHPINVILSSGLEGVSPDWPFFQAADVRRVLFISKALEPAKLQAFEKTSQVILLNPPKKDHSIAQQIVQHLTALGAKNLLVEGGGSVMWDFVQDNLIDEYHVTLTPRILGGTEAPTLVDGKGFAADDILNLKLKDCKVVGQEIFLVYSKTESRGKELPE